MTLIILLDDNINSVDTDWFVHYYMININISLLVLIVYPYYI